MQLYEVDISGTAKEKIRNIVDEHVRAAGHHSIADRIEVEWAPGEFAKWRFGTLNKLLTCCVAL